MMLLSQLGIGNAIFLAYVTPFIFFPSAGSLEIPRWKGNSRICLHPDSSRNTLSVLRPYFLWLPISSCRINLYQEPEQNPMSQYSKCQSLASIVGHHDVHGKFSRENKMSVLIFSLNIKELTNKSSQNHTDLGNEKQRSRKVIGLVICSCWLRPSY
jgi:hypothetical protein